MKLILKRIVEWVSIFTSIPIVLIIRIIKPFVYIKLGYFFDSRIGHLTIDTFLQLAEQKISSEPKSYNWFWLSRNVCNKQWSKMMKRNLFIKEWIRPIEKCNKLIPGGENHIQYPAVKFGSRDLKGLIEKTKIDFKFTKEEIKNAKSWLKGKGWNEGEKFICLMVRDSAYLTNKSISRVHKFEHHDYRNSNILTYRKSVIWLVEQGFWVLRMGKIMQEPLSIDHPKVLDYAFDIDRSDLLDVWLIANCYFGISTLTGMDSIAICYKRPMVFVNAMPIGHIISWADVIHVPKNLFWKNSGEDLSLKEHISHYYFSTQEYNEAGIGIRNLNEDEILDAVKERLERLNNVCNHDNQTFELQTIFWRLMKENIPKNTHYARMNGFDDLHGWIHPKASIGSQWLNNLSN